MRGFKVLTVLALALAAHAQEYVIPTFAGGAPPATPVLGVNMPLGSLQSVAADAIGNTYFIASHCVFKLDQNGVVTRIAGNRRPGYSGDGGPATSARLRLDNVSLSPPLLPISAPPGLAVDNAGNVYVADNDNYRIRKISGQGIITTVVGNGTARVLRRRRAGPAASARLVGPQGVAVDTGGKILIADTGDNRIRKVKPGGIIPTVAGSSPAGTSPSQGGFSGDGGPAIDGQLSVPADVAVDGAGNVYIADYGNNRIRKVSQDGNITTIAGNGTQGYSGDGGPATRASFLWPSALAVDTAGNIYVVDKGNNAIRVLRPVDRPHAR